MTANLLREVGSVETTESRKTIAVNLTPRARAIIDSIRDESGVPNTEAMARILEWFAGLDRKHRTAILTKDVDAQREYLRLVLDQIVGDELLAAEAGPLDKLNLRQLHVLQKRTQERIEELGMRFERDYKTTLAKAEKKKG